MITDSLPAFRLLRPQSVADAATALAAEPGARLVAGGTDLLANLRRGLERPPVVIDLGAVAGLAEVQHGADGLTLGAGVTLDRLATDAALAAAWPALGEAARAAAGPGHRSAATLGGNLCLDTRCVFYNQSEWWRLANAYCLKRGGSTCHVAPQGSRCHAAFSGDLAPVLLALDARITLQSVRGTRTLALAEAYRDDGAAHLTIARDEVLVRAHLPAPAAGTRCAYRKARVRGAMDFPLAGVAVALRLDQGRIAGLRVALTGTNSHPLLLQGTEALLGQAVDDAACTALGKLVQKQVSPMRTTVTAANHRRQVGAVLAQRLLRELAAA